MSLIDLEELGLQFQRNTSILSRRIVVCGGSACIANGAMIVRDALRAELEKRGEKTMVEIDYERPPQDGVFLSKSGCQGFCHYGPLVRIEPDRILYCRVKPEDAAEIVEKTLLGGEIIERLLYIDPKTKERSEHETDVHFCAKQRRVLLGNYTTDPEDVREYISRGGYEGARKAALMTPEQVCLEIQRSGLRGRGGTGFPTGLKLKITLASEGNKKYVLCNGDEGDPGAFIKRSVMEGNPHAVIEGMMIAGRAIGSDEGFIYIPAEYPLAIRRMRRAIDDARKVRALGDNIFGLGFNFEISIMEGLGSFVCSEENSLLHFVKRRRGVNDTKTLFPSVKGLFGKPTAVCNVETMARFPMIIRDGAEKYRELGLPDAPGTKIFSLSGHVANPGLVEVPFGTTLREIIYDVGGGIVDKAGNVTQDECKAIQAGGPLGICFTPEYLDRKIDRESAKFLDSSVSSGGLVVMNKETCMVRMTRFFIQYIQTQSCGKCLPCREGAKQMLALLDDIISGKGTLDTLALLEETATTVNLGSVCALGKNAGNPVLSALTFFRSEFEAHIVDKVCPTHECQALARPEINPSVCKGCTMCARKCPAGAISGERKVPHHIDLTKCVRCGVCKSTCKFGAVGGF